MPQHVKHDKAWLPLVAKLIFHQLSCLLVDVLLGAFESDDVISRAHVSRSGGQQANRAERALMGCFVPPLEGRK